MNEERKESYKIKFKLLATISIIQSLLLWFIVYTYAYKISPFENILIGIVFVIFYAIVFVKKQVKTLVNKTLEW